MRDTTVSKKIRVVTCRYAELKWNSSTDATCVVDRREELISSPAVRYIGRLLSAFAVNACVHRLEVTPMRLKPLWISAAAAAAALAAAGTQLRADQHTDWGLAVQQHLRANSWDLFGILNPLAS